MKNFFIPSVSFVTFLFASLTASGQQTQCLRTALGFDCTTQQPQTSIFDSYSRSYDAAVQQQMPQVQRLQQDQRIYEEEARRKNDASQMDAALDRIANNINQSLPKKLEGMTHTKVGYAKENKTITFYYSVEGDTSSAVELAKSKQYNNVKNICKPKDDPFFAAGITYLYVYIAENKFAWSHAINKSTCPQG